MPCHPAGSFSLMTQFESVTFIPRNQNQFHTVHLLHLTVGGVDPPWYPVVQYEENVVSRSVLCTDRGLQVHVRVQTSLQWDENPGYLGSVQTQTLKTCFKKKQE